MSKLDLMNAVLFFELKDKGYDEFTCRQFFQMLRDAEKLGLVIDFPDSWLMPQFRKEASKD